MQLEETLPWIAQKARTRQSIIPPLLKPTCRCVWERVARRRWLDLLSWVGWYPWQCRRCQTRSYFRSRF